MTFMSWREARETSEPGLQYKKNRPTGIAFRACIDPNSNQVFVIPADFVANLRVKGFTIYLPVSCENAGRQEFQSLINLLEIDLKRCM